MRHEGDRVTQEKHKSVNYNWFLRRRWITDSKKKSGTAVLIRQSRLLKIIV